ncbi:hypothetical protein ACFQX4_25175 [Roseomonas sp. GCM10028921]
MAVAEALRAKAEGAAEAASARYVDLEGQNRRLEKEIASALARAEAAERWIPNTDVPKTSAFAAAQSSQATELRGRKIRGANEGTTAGSAPAADAEGEAGGSLFKLMGPEVEPRRPPT